MRSHMVAGFWICIPGGLLAATSEPSSSEGYSKITEYTVKSYCGPYGIPLRIMIAKDVDNLMMAGRNVSVTHAALGTVRVMATGALLGQAAGTAAAIAINKGMGIKSVPAEAIDELQQTLLRDGCFLPNAENRDPLDLARQATIRLAAKLPYGAGPESATSLPRMVDWEERNNPNNKPDEVLHHKRRKWYAILVTD